ncbi:MAG: zinc-ribbon domain-containing protein [Desulfomicrobium sp.]|nr:zinc-ribbon domain-containing protein [Pseudomonadota bacterium]MBV1710560.1 zinc-ribbon domain-containing protein [Desulfomicrobium sp.]MBU4570168.1 zinc-ribbon domain-containing protein [Pseudomonadota bacterium]MBU4593088.1 zinc-ribbon domain-containing protein [Pseudomonadota bacterium]MBV1720428.1 zinc-ribbon domain-containing protein [Desulfomicrobium sp.]
MLVQCPECTTKFNLDESKIGHDGSKVRCSRCKNVFTVFRPMTEAVDAQPAPVKEPARKLFEEDASKDGPAGVSDDRKPAPATAKDSFEDDLAAMFEDIKPAPKKPSPADDFEDDLAAMLDAKKPAVAQKSSPVDDFEDDLAAMLDAKKPVGAHKSSPADDFEDDLTAMLDEKMPKAASKSSVDEDMIADLQGAFQQPLTAKLDEDSLASGRTPAGRTKKSTSVGLVVGLVFLLLACAGAGVYFLKPGLIGLGPKAPGAPAATQEPVVREGAAQIALENVRQYFVPNEKEGQLFIIEGKAVNRFPEARELIRIKAALFDKLGNEVATQEFMCGNVVSLYQLQVSTRADIEAALTAKVGILTNNTNIQSGASVPFMAVFFQTPETVEEFGLEVIQSSVPQQ